MSTAIVGGTLGATFLLAAVGGILAFFALRSRKRKIPTTASERRIIEWNTGPEDPKTPKTEGDVHGSAPNRLIPVAASSQEPGGSELAPKPRTMPLASESLPSHVRQSAEKGSRRRKTKSKGIASSRNYAKSYAGLASLMNANPEKAILRRFGDLNMLNLLYLQAELVDLEDELHEVAGEDDEMFTRDWGRLAHTEDERQWGIILEIRRVMKEYSESPYSCYLFVSI